MIPFGEWLPDLPTLGNPGALEALNVVPAGFADPKAGGIHYRPLPAPAAYSAALDARAQGMVAVRNASGTVILFAGDATKLYRLATGTAWADKSKSGGYTTGTEERWAFAQYLDRVIATNYADPIQAQSLTGTSAFADLAAAAPRCRHLAVAKGFLIAGNTYDSTDGAQPQRIWWPAINDPTSWPTPGSAGAIAVQSDYQDLAGAGGAVQGIIAGLPGADAVVMQERAMQRMVYVGGDTFWEFDPVEGGRGAITAGSIAQVGSRFFFLSEDGFYVSDGASAVPIGANKIDKWFFNTAAAGKLPALSATVDPVNKLYMVAFCSSSATVGVPDNLVIHNWETGAWSRAEVTTELLQRSLGIGYSLEDFDTFGTLDALPFSLDSAAWAGGRLLLAGFDSLHRLAYFNGSNLQAVIDTGEAQLIQGYRATVKEVWPLIDGGTVTASIGYRDRQQDSVTYSTAQAQNTTGFCPARVNARYHRARVTIAAGGSWTKAQGIDVDAARSGRR